MEYKLKRCPFCGSKAEMLEYHEQKKYYRPSESKIPPYAKLIKEFVFNDYKKINGQTEKIKRTGRIYSYAMYNACCSRTGCMGRNLNRKTPYKDKAAEQWNRRTEDAAD